MNFDIFNPVKYLLAKIVTLKPWFQVSWSNDTNTQYLLRNLFSFCMEKTTNAIVVCMKNFRKTFIWVIHKVERKFDWKHTLVIKDQQLLLKEAYISCYFQKHTSVAIAWNFHIFKEKIYEIKFFALQFQIIREF